MKRTFLSAALTVSVSSGMSSFGCSGNSDALDNTAVEPSRDSRISSLADDACDAYETCKGYGTATGQSFATKGDCETSLKSRATMLWTEADCGHGQINNDRFTTCVNSAKVFVCSDNFLQSISTFTACNSDQVCTDPAQ